MGQASPGVVYLTRGCAGLDGKSEGLQFAVLGNVGPDIFATDLESVDVGGN